MYVDLSKEDLGFLQESLSCLKMRLFEQTSEKERAQQGVKQAVKLSLTLQEALVELEERENPTPTERDLLLDKILEERWFQVTFPWLEERHVNKLEEMLRKTNDEHSIRSFALWLGCDRELALDVLAQAALWRLGGAYVAFYHYCDNFELQTHVEPLTVSRDVEEVKHVFLSAPIPTTCPECEFEYLIEEGEEYENVTGDWRRELLIRT